MPPFLFAYDFYYLWAAGALLHQGKNPYDLVAFTQELRALGWPAYETVQGLTHPPSNLWLYWVFGVAPFQLAATLWLSLSILLAIISAISFAQCLKITNLPRPLIAFCALAFPPMLGTVIWGQVNALLVFALAVFSRSFLLGAPVIAGLAMSLLCFKPQMFAAFIATVLLWELLQRRVTLILGFIAGVALQLAASSLISPHCIAWYLDRVPHVIQQSSHICGATLGQLLECEFGWSFIRPALVVAGICVSALLPCRYGYTINTLLLMALPLSVIASPYSWSHSFVVLLPSFLVVVNKLRRTMSIRGALYSVVLFALCSLPLLVNAHVQFPWIAVPIALLLLGREPGANDSDQQKANQLLPRTF
jgi:hypothetical protein